MASTGETYTIRDLADLTGETPRTIRFYISSGLLPGARGRGPSARYDQRHLAAIKLVQALQAEHRPLKEIKARLADLSDRQITALAEIAPAVTGERWRRVRLHPDIELHVRERTEGAADPLQEAVALICDLAQPVIERLNQPR